MINISKFEGFEWDIGNQDKNWEKHKISNIEAEQIFFNEPILIIGDKKHSTDKEKRYAALGITNYGRELTAIFTIRNNFIRIISARHMSSKERKIYYEETEKNPEI